MLTEKENKNISKFLSLILRHQPDQIGIELDEQGWTDVAKLIENSAAAGVIFDKDMLMEVVSTNAKQRFSFNDTFDKIRANQGHSVNVDLGYSPQTPPDILYHGTAVQNVQSIMQHGLQKRERHHVHLSNDRGTAINVGQRHGKPIVFEVLAAEMYKDNFSFFVSDNGVWLTDYVPAKYLRQS